MIVSKITADAQTTIRSALGLREGDELAYVIEDGRVILTKAPARTIRLEEPFATFWEWSSPEDAEDYADL